WGQGQGVLPHRPCPTLQVAKEGLPLSPPPGQGPPGRPPPRRSRTRQAPGRLPRSQRRTSVHLPVHGTGSLAARLGTGGEARRAHGEPSVQTAGDAVVQTRSAPPVGHQTGGDRLQVALHSPRLSRRLSSPRGAGRRGGDSTSSLTTRGEPLGPT